MHDSLHPGQSPTLRECTGTGLPLWLQRQRVAVLSAEAVMISRPSRENCARVTAPPCRMAPRQLPSRMSHSLAVLSYDIVTARWLSLEKQAPVTPSVWPAIGRSCE